MTHAADDWIGLTVAVALMIVMVVALLWPERF